MNYRSLNIVLPMLMWLSVGPLPSTAAAQGNPKDCYAMSAVGEALAGGVQGGDKEPRPLPFRYSRDGGWFSQVLDRDLHVYSVAFSTPMTGLVVGMHGKVYRTEDGGSSWTVSQAPTPYYIATVEYVTDDIWMAAGKNGTILRTTNGGRDWVRQETGTNWILRGVSFTDSITGTVIGERDILRTTDGGEHWTPQDGGIPAQLYEVVYTDAVTGIIVGKDGVILRTTNAGTVWQPLESVTTYDLNDVCFIDKQTGIAVGDNGVILRTEDGGENWTHVPSPTSMNLEGVMFPTSRIGTIVGMNGCILRSTDGGQSWEEQISNSLSYLWGVFFTDPYNGTAVGSEGTVLRTTTGGVTWIDTPAPTPQHVALHQNSPNPFNPSTTIHFTLTQSQRVSLVVTDHYGREMRRLIDGDFKEAGLHHVPFDAAGLPSGVYFYTLITGRYRLTRKMVLLR